MCMCVLTHTHLSFGLFSFAWYIRFKLFACAFKTLKYSDSGSVSCIDACCNSLLPLRTSVPVLPRLLSQLPVFYWAAFVYGIPSFCIT